MSVSRSVQAAQRRRAGPSEPQQSRGPGTSINSAQTFSNQSTKTSSRTSASANNTMNPSTSDITKLTVAQAITLITLRLGKVERNINQVSYDLVNGMNSENDGEVDSENTTLVDNSVFQSFLSRLDSLEQKSVTEQPSFSSNSEIAGLKSQIDAIKMTIVQNKNVYAKELKTQGDALKTEIERLKSQLSVANNTVTGLQNLMSEIASSQFGGSENMVEDGEEGYGEEDGEEDGEEEEEEELNQEIIETNLKELIEQELKQVNK